MRHLQHVDQLAGLLQQLRDTGGSCVAATVSVSML
jgi:hypothetical protein